MESVFQMFDTTYGPRSLDDQGYPGYLIDINGLLYDTQSNYWKPNITEQHPTWTARYVLRCNNNIVTSPLRSVAIEDLVAFAFYKEGIIDGPYADRIREVMEFKLLLPTNRKIIYSTGRTQYAVTKNGEVWNVNTCRKLTPRPMYDSRRKLQLPYLNVQLSGKFFKVHRLVAVAYCLIPQYLLDAGHTFDTLQVNHKDGNPANNHWTNLEWVTNDENMAHRTLTSSNFKISNETLLKIGDMLAERRTDAEIADFFKIDKMTVHNIRARSLPRYKLLPQSWPRYVRNFSKNRERLDIISKPEAFVDESYINMQKRIAEY